MRLFPLQAAVMPLFLFGILSVPSITPHTASSDGMSQSSVKDQRSANNSGKLHSLTITGLTSKDSEENIILDSSERLNLECILKADSMQIPNITWKHGEEEISRDFYKGNSTTGEWRTTLEVFVEDVNSTGSYACVFSSFKEAKATFHVKVPAIHGGGKTIVTYNGDYTVLKCDSYNYKPVEWLWYKVNGSEQVLLNGSRYKQVSKKANETELHVSQLIEEDNGTYVCKAFFTTGYSEGQLHINVLSLMVPFKIFIAIVVEVVVLVAAILGYELVSKKKPTEEDVKSEDEQMGHLKTEENGTSEASSTRQRKV